MDKFLLTIFIFAVAGWRIEIALLLIATAYAYFGR
jgi:hypothetical protein